MLPVWLILLVVGISLFAETIYVVALQDVAQTFHATQSQAMLTMTSYFLGFACAMLFWGIISDKYGRKQSLIVGLILFVIATYGCYISDSIWIFTIMRFIQAFGCTAGSVLGQVIIRDVLSGVELAKMSSLLSIAWLGFPAISPLVGGIFVHFFPWQYLFLTLMIIGCLILFFIIWKLPETNHLNRPDENEKKVSLWGLTIDMMRNRKTLSSIFIIAACNGLVFSYYAEGSFYFRKLLNMGEISYSLTFLLILIANVIGGFVSKRLQKNFSPKIILSYSLYCAFIGIALFLLKIIVNEYFFQIPYLEWFLFCDLFISFLGIAIMNPNAFFLGLEDYRCHAGRATSLFGFIYCINGALYVFIMGVIHSESLFIMPLYFGALLICALFVDKIMCGDLNKKCSLEVVL